MNVEDRPTIEAVFELSAAPELDTLSLLARQEPVERKTEEVIA